MKLVKNSLRIIAVLSLSVFLLGARSSSAHAASFDVVAGFDSVTNDGDCSLSEAMNNIADHAQTYADCVAPGDSNTINLPVGTITLVSSLPQIDTPLNVIGQGRDQSFIDGSGQSVLFYDTVSDSTLNAGFTMEFRDFTASNISRNSGSPCISASHATSNSSYAGTLSISNVDLINCGVSSITGALSPGSLIVNGVNISSDHSSGTTSGITSAYDNTLTNISNTSISGFSVGITAVAFQANANWNLTNNTITDNRLGFSFGVNAPGQTVNLTNNTIVGNTGEVGSYPFDVSAGIRLYVPDVQGAEMNLNMKNNLIANNNLGGNLSNCGIMPAPNRVTATSSSNLSDDNCAGKLGVDDLANLADASSHLGALADNGGEIRTMALLQGSQAIDGGEAGDTVPVNDARGTLRPQGGDYDIGAFELVYGEIITDPPPPDPETPDPPRTGVLLGGLMVIVSGCALLILVSKEMIDVKSKKAKSVK